MMGTANIVMLSLVALLQVARATEILPVPVAAQVPFPFTPLAHSLRQAVANKTTVRYVIGQVFAYGSSVCYLFSRPFQIYKNVCSLTLTPFICILSYLPP